MVPLEPTLRRAYFAGFAVAVGFRWFATGGIWGICRLALKLHWRGDLGLVATALLWIIALSAVYFIPFAAGFVATFFWRPIHWRRERHDEKNALAGSALLAWLPLLALTSCVVLLPLLFDVWFCEQGARRGRAFWNSRQGRQFLGDFSTRDGEEREA